MHHLTIQYNHQTSTMAWNLNCTDFITYIYIHAGSDIYVYITVIYTYTQAYTHSYWYLLDNCEQYSNCLKYNIMWL